MICGAIVTDKIFPVALKLWLVFLLAFLLLGYEIVPSIIFGAIAGLAGGTVSAWWQTLVVSPRPPRWNPMPSTNWAKSSILDRSKTACPF